ncbi:zinc ribbon domain-containing protein [uncultured Methanobrevibacter sp.]|uniref:zinc ribbon domain-containing protein n=1 Tax=uncultured Methanobrevibacter sp. TaxID=253161 RepID=UPI0025E71ECC|nr:zinc ribbon domain-containing protein [uncultured Methanobrevibacter sp.]
MAKLKICKNCGKKINATSNFCPHCKSESFEDISTMDNIKYLLFYWQVNGGYILSKTKVITLFIFISSIIDWFISGNFAIFLDTITAVALFGVGFAFHMILKNDKPSENVVNHTDNGLIIDLMQLLFYWQDKETGEYEVSMTKTLSIIAAVIVGLYYNIATANLIILKTFGASLVIVLPIFTIGYIIHRFKD